MIAVFIFCAILLSYLLTVAPTISFFDSGELISGAYTLGISHPPGYPVYVTLGKLFTLMPFGNVAYRMNLLSVFFAAMASVMVYYITRAMLEEEGDGRALPGLRTAKFGIPEASGLFAALAFGLSYTLWAWAVASKFYTLNAFVVTCIVMLLIRWKRARKEDTALAGHSLRYLYLIAFIWGIAGAVHISQFVLIPVYLMYILLVDWRSLINFMDKDGKEGEWTAKKVKNDLKRPTSIILLVAIPAVVMTVQLIYHPLDFALKKLHLGSPTFGALLIAICCGIACYLLVRDILRTKTLVIMLFFFALGHSVFLHLPIRAAQVPLIDWGGAVDWKQFKWTYNREGYQVVGGVRSIKLFMQQIKSFDMVREFGWAGIPLILGGIYAHFRKDWRGAALLVGGAVLLTFAVVYGGNPPVENIFLLEQFYIPVYIFLAVLVGGAVQLVLKRHPAAPWLLGFSLPFIFIGDIPAGASGSFRAAGEGLMASLKSSQYLYLAAYAALAIAICGGAWAIMKGRLSKRPAIFLSLALVLFVLYPASQLKANYWLNDRSKNFIAYDMGNAELNFSPEFSVLFTWGDSGAFPMWYLQFVEHKRPDVLLVHTPHLPLDWFLYSIKRKPMELGDKSQIKDDYSLLRNYNGIKGIERILQIPQDFRDPAMVIKEIIKLNPGRKFQFDYSSRYSIIMPYSVQPYGITYRKQEEGYVDDNLRIWRFLVNRGLPNPTISLDLDDSKAVHIYGYVLSDLGQQYMIKELKPMAEQAFVDAIKYSPDLWRTLAPYMR